MTMRISDHALLRWLDRVHGLDIEALREQMRGTLQPHYVKGISTIVVEGYSFPIAPDGTVKSCVIGHIAAYRTAKKIKPIKRGRG